MIDASKINERYLPPQLRVLARRIGAQAALNFAETFGGQDLYIPDHPTANHPIAHCVGHNHMATVCRYYGGTTMTVTKIDSAAIQLRHAVVKDMTTQGASEREIVLATGYTGRRVRQLRAGIRDNRQTDLFAGDK